MPSCLLEPHQTYKSDNSITSNKNDQSSTNSVTAGNPNGQQPSNIVPLMIDTARRCRHNANDIISAYRISIWQKILTVNYFNIAHIPQWIRCNQCKQLRTNKNKTTDIIESIANQPWFTNIVIKDCEDCLIIQQEPNEISHSMFEILALDISGLPQI